MSRLKYLLFLLFFGSFSLLNAQDLYFAGFSFIGDTTQNENYPVAYGIYKANPKILNQELNESLKKLKRTDLNIIKDELGKQKSGNALALAYGLQKEAYVVYQVEGGYQSKFEITGLIYVFDYSDNEHKLLTSIPTGKSLSLITPAKLSKNEIAKVFEAMYLTSKNQKIYGTNLTSSVFDDWVSNKSSEMQLSLENAKIFRASKEKRLQLRNIELDDAVKKQIPGNSDYIKDEKALKTETARNFESYLSAYQNVPILPSSYSVGQALAGTMIARFADTSYELKIPPPDYVIDLTVREFKKSAVDNKVYDAYLYGAFITMKVLQPDLNNIKLESKFNYIDGIQVPKNYKLKIEDDWPSWIGAQKKLFEILSKQISIKDEKELANLTKTPDIKEQLKRFEDVINECK